MTENDQLDIVLAESGKQNPGAEYLNSLHSLTSRSTQLDALNLVARHLLKIEDIGRRKPGEGKLDFMLVNWAMLRNADLEKLQTWLLAKTGAKLKPATARRCIAAVRGTLKKAWKNQQMSTDDYMRTISLNSIRGTSTVGRMISNEEGQALFATCGKGAPVKAARDEAILMLMVGYTARRAEVTTLQLSDFVPDYKLGIGRLVIHGKGSKDREVFLANGEREKMIAWIKIRGTKPGPLFYAMTQADELTDHNLTPIAVYKMVKRRMERAGIPDATVHDLRRTAISNLLDNTDTLTTARIAGHGSATVTATYDKRGERAVIAALGKVHLPFSQKNAAEELLK